MNRFFTLLLAAFCLTAFGQDDSESMVFDGFSFIYLGDSTAFFMSDHQLPWDQAQQSCWDLGGHLATFATYEENMAVVEASIEGFWFGLSQSPGASEPDLGWGWVTGEQLNYLAWFTSEPNNATGAEDCAIQTLQDYPAWDDATCSYSYRYVLEVTAVEGCTNPAACNYNFDALLDDGSCDLFACRCLEGTIWSEELGGCIVDESACGWQPDGNGDNLIGINDLLDLLGVYGDTDYDQDGIWDSADDCVGEYDECGVCNGSGPSIPIIESIEILYDSVYAEPIDEWFVFEVGADTSYSYVCFVEGCTDSSALNFDANAIADNGSCEYPWECGDPLEYQGEEYETVLIGERCWFKEPLRVSNFSNGDVIPSMSNFADGFFELNQIFYYQWNVAVDERSVCPSGWQVPSKADYELLPLGGSLVAHPYGSLLHGYVNCCSNSVTNNGPYELSWTRNGYADDSAWRFTDNSSSSGIGVNPKDNGETIRCIKDAE